MLNKFIGISTDRFRQQVFSPFGPPRVFRGAEKRTWHEQLIQVLGSDAPNRMVRNVVIPTLTIYNPLWARLMARPLI